MAIYVKYYGRPNAYWMPAVPNNTLGTTGILVFEADLSTESEQELSQFGWLISDESWRARKVDAWDEEWRAPGEESRGLPIEVFDARRFPHGWQEVEFEDSGWGHAQVVAAMHVGGFARTQPPTDPYGPLHPRPIAQLEGLFRQPVHMVVERLRGEPDTSSGNPYKRVQASLNLPATPVGQSADLPLSLDVARGEPVRLTLDMGRIVSGFVRFAIDAPPGTLFDLSYTEDPLHHLAR